MTRTGSVPVRSGIGHAIWADELHPDPTSLQAEHWLTQLPMADLEEPWFFTLREARREYVKAHRSLPERLVFDQAEAERVAALPQMREHVNLWRSSVGKDTILPCGLPKTIWGMEVIILA